MAVISTGPGVGRLTSTSRPPIITDSAFRRRFSRVSGMGRLGLTCPAGQTPTNMYDGSVQCCGGPTPESDPCSYLNQNVGYQQTQEQAQANAIAGDAGVNSAMLAQLAVYPQNVQNAAIECYSNPGVTFFDELGNKVTCPSGSIQNLSGGSTSIYTFQQLAAQLAPNLTPTTETPINTVDVTNSGQGGNALDNVTPTKTAAPVTSPGSNALSTSASQTSQTNTPSTQQIANSNNVTGNVSNAQGGGAASDVTIGGVDVTSWIEQNWVLLAAGAAALLILPGLMKGGR